MNRKPSIVRHVTIFVLAQVAWLSLVGGWIYWYVSNHIVISTVSESVKLQDVSPTLNIVVLVVGLLLLIGLSVAMSLIFRNLNLQVNIAKLYDNFIANVTHELKTPLTSIQIYLETMRDRKVPEKRRKEFLELMINDANRLHNLINSILNISRLEQKKIAYNFQIHDADTFVKSLLEEICKQFQLSTKSIKVGGAATCQIVAERHAFESVFVNLVDNAVKYTVGIPEIQVTLLSSTKNFIIKFTDNGIGIASKRQKRIFEKFHRIYDPESPNVKGTGLGLYWVAEIVKFHGGNISIFSKGKNTGTTFTIELPIYPSTKSRYINNLLKLTKKWRQITNQSDKELHATKK
jgi:two-component system, OmpR family, phosphate regulon sensor histidine kinase PhoR